MKDQGKKPFGKRDRSERASGDRDNKPFKAFRSKESSSADRTERKTPVGRGLGKPSLGGKGKKRPIEPEKKTALLRLNQFIAKAGVCSRREADELILSGKIRINGKIVREMGRRVQVDDKVEFEGRQLQGEELRYVLLNKPKGFISNVTDEKDRKTVMDLVKKACKERIYPVGRLERDTTGLLLFTNDGELARRLTHPGAKVKQIYHVFLDKSMEENDVETLIGGIKLGDETIKPDVVNYVQEVEDGTQLGAQFHSGRNTFVRDMFEYFGYKVEKLDRVLYANLTKKDIPRGKWRFLKDKEISMLKVIAGKGNIEGTAEAPKTEIKKRKPAVSKFAGSKKVKPRTAKSGTSPKSKKR